MVAFLVYLILEHKERRAGLFLLMVEALVLTAIAVLSLEGKRRILEHSVNNSKEEL